jgi:transposase
MMGYQTDDQRKLFYTQFNLDKRVRQSHILRKVAKHVDFDFIYQEVENKYGSRGNVSVPPPVILKAMLLLIFYNVRSERELMDTLPERLDWLWFLGYDLDDDIPNHSVLSKARSRWGVEAFQTFFEHIVWQCVEAGLIDGSKIFVDASLVKADASNNSVVNKESLKRYLKKSYRELEQRLDDDSQGSGEDGEKTKRGEANRKYISTTDPDASVVRMGQGRSKLRYKIHRSVDEKSEVITATDVTPGEVDEAHCLPELIDQHQRNIQAELQTVVADNKYGTIDNFISCYDSGIEAHFRPIEKGNRNRGRREGIFELSEFKYDPSTDTFTCPTGHRLKRRKYYKKRKHYEYIASKQVCNQCELRSQCTRSKSGRTLKRHIRQDDLDRMLRHAESKRAKNDIRKRQHLMERSFARSDRYGFKRARWRRLWRVRIQEYLTAAIQNIMILIKSVKEQCTTVAANRISVQFCVDNSKSWLCNLFRVNMWLHFSVPHNTKA